jgi:hypothetical protein
MPDAPTQPTDKPSALSLVQKFLQDNKIVIYPLPLKTWRVDKGRLVVDPPQISVEYIKEEPALAKETNGKKPKKNG